MSCTKHRDQALTGLDIPQVRAGLVHEIIYQVEAGWVETGTALLMLDVIGLTGDRGVLSDALAAKDLADGLRDGRYDPFFIDPQLRVPRDEAVDVLAAAHDDQYADAVRRLAVRRVTPDALAAVSA